MNSPDKTLASTFSIFEPLESRQMFAAGALDPTFGFGSGKAGIGLPGRATAEDVAVQSDGKTVVVGTFEDGAREGRPRRLVVARLNADGTPDRAFGKSDNGTVPLGFGVGSAVAIQPDGRIVVVGTVGLDKEGATPAFAVLRLLPDGKLDRSFDGSRAITVKGRSFARDVALQPDGKIVVVGSDFNSGGFLQFGDNDFAIARLNRDGSLDKSFANGGKRIIGMGEDERAFAVAIDTNGTPSSNPNFGKIVLAGERTSDDIQQYAIARLNPNGGLDTTFDDDGMLAAKFKGYSKAFVNGVAIQPDGKVVVAGHAQGGTNTDTPIAVARHLASGHIDHLFGKRLSGTATIDFGGDDIGGDVMLSTGGGLVVAGTTDGKFALAALTTDGVLDTRFGTEGKVVTDFGRFTTATLVAMAASPHKRITVAGGDRLFGFQTARYLDFGAFVLADRIDPKQLPQLQIEPRTVPTGPVIISGTASARPVPTVRIFSRILI